MAFHLVACEPCMISESSTCERALDGFRRQRHRRPLCGERRSLPSLRGPPAVRAREGAWRDPGPHRSPDSGRPQGFPVLRPCGNFEPFLRSSSLGFRGLLRSFPRPAGCKWQTENWHLPFRRFASRTTIFRRTMDDEFFKGKPLSDLRGRRPLLIMNAAELRTGSAFYFSPTGADHGGLVDWRRRISRSPTRSPPRPPIPCSYRRSTRTSRSTAAMEPPGRACDAY